MKLSRMMLVMTMVMGLVLSGCSGYKKGEVLEELKPREAGTYAIHLFYEGVLPDSETTELNIFYNSTSELLKTMTIVQFWDQVQDRNVKWAKAIGVKQFPMYVVMDHDGIVLETPYLSQVEAFLTGAVLGEN
ncbi:hypothetical protein [Paenibacillus sp. NPDC057967]|uniref:hypothetical protein n=1 Tax=Paenibacillus sp. NPDC057967 TaxID=3346293 RepID=UPI0036D92B0B